MFEDQDSRVPPPGRLCKAGEYCWAAFTGDFTPTGSTVTVLADVVGGCIPPSAVGLFCQVEANYVTLLPEIVRSLCSKISIAPATIQQRFKLDTIDLRGHLRPSTCVLHYRTDLEFDWYVRVSHDYRVECCGPLD